MYIVRVLVLILKASVRSFSIPLQPRWWVVAVGSLQTVADKSRRHLLLLQSLGNREEENNVKHMTVLYSCTINKV